MNCDRIRLSERNDRNCMKNRIIRILLVLLIIIHIAAPILELAIWGYGITELLSDLYNNAVIIILSIAVLRLYNSKGEDE